jgi:uncharacterized protein (TIGR02391 family)
MAKRPNPKAEADLRDATLSFNDMEVAIKKIDRRLEELSSFDVRAIVENTTNPNLRALEISLNGFLIDTFGSDTTQYAMYSSATHLHAIERIFFGGQTVDIAEVRQNTAKNIAKSIAVLKAMKTMFSEKLEDAGRSSSSKPLRAYEALDLHPEIERQVGQLYRDGHHAEAIEKAVKVLNNLVRLRSGEDLDGSALMTKVFNKNNPGLKFNSLTDQSDQDEQQGFMYLFAGAVMGLRNPRAHKIIKDDPERALEFIAFISLLAKMLDETQ